MLLIHGTGVVRYVNITLRSELYEMSVAHNRLDQLQAVQRIQTCGRGYQMLIVYFR